MGSKLLVLISMALLISSCEGKGVIDQDESFNAGSNWTIKDLEYEAGRHLDSANWDVDLFKQDIETYNQYSEIFNSFPLNKSPFPVAEYDYAVSSTPFTISSEEAIIKGVHIGAYKSPESEIIENRLTLLVLTNDLESEESTLVESRNYPYLTAQGIFKVSNNDFDWVFMASPDGSASLIINMKLFDLRFGQTIIIYPQTDKSFLYDQITDSPNNYDSYEAFEASILKNARIRHQLTSPENID